MVRPGMVTDDGIVTGMVIGENCFGAAGSLAVTAKLLQRLAM